MPKGVYIRTEEHNRNNGIAKTGRSLSEEHKQKLRLANIGQTHTAVTKEHLRVANTGINNPNYGKPRSEETKRKIRTANSGINHPMYGIRGVDNPNYGKHLTDETKRKVSASKIGTRHTKDTKLKMRVAALRRILRDGAILAIGKNEKALLDTQEHLDNVVITRQYPIHKLGYIVDGYCAETNTVYEVYEQQHKYQIQEDLQRETEICNLFGCNFRIIWDK